LPGIGQLTLTTTPAETDFSNKQIVAPFQSIVFVPISGNKNSYNEFSAISELMKKNLDEDGSIHLDGIGDFYKETNGTIRFEQVILNPVFLQPVTAVRTIRQDAEHNILVGDKKTTNVEMAEFLNEETPIPPDRWWIWAIVLGLIGIGLLTVYFIQNGWSLLGNCNPVM
jgi:hypothetical protein